MDKLKYKDKKVLIFGLGINQGGVGSAKFFARQGAKLRITDLKQADQLQTSVDQLKQFPGIEYTFGEHRYEDLDWADLIIKNPGVKPNNPYIDYALNKGERVEMDMGIFLEYANPDQIIGITGTKGKSTTASMVYDVLKQSGKQVVFAGNIGKSVLDTVDHLKPNTLIVLELSSFQLDAFRLHQVSPKWAVITNIFPDHLNFYPSMDSYITAKRNIAVFQKPEDLLFIKRGDKVTDQPEFLKDLKARVNYFSSDDLPGDFLPNLPGKHNLENMAAALAISKAFDIPEDHTLKVLAGFKGVDFRMQLVKEYNGIKIYNDTAATNPDAASQALQSVHNPILIAGGTNKNLPYKGFAESIDKYAKAVFFLIGDATDEITKYLQNTDKVKGEYGDMAELVEDIKTFAQSGDTILFSPGAASFNLFQNEFDRGRKFNEAVERVFGKE